jgi:transaldolase
MNYIEWLTTKTNTKWWIDTAVLKDIKEGFKHGMCGVTTNPVLAGQVVSADPSKWADIIKTPGIKPEEKAVKLTESIVKEIAALLMSEYEKSNGAQGYVCAQLNPEKCFDKAAMLEMAKRYAGFGPNIAIKIPGTKAGMETLEECAALGFTTASTLNFTVSQAVAVLESYKRGVKRAKAAGKKPGKCFTAVMVGRLDDYLKEVAKDSGISIEDSTLMQAGISCLKRAYELYQKEETRPLLIPAAMRGTHHVTEFAGADLVLSVPPKVLAPLINDNLPQEERINKKPDAKAIDVLMKLPEFRKAYEFNGLKQEEFISFGLTQKTLGQFIHSGWGKLESAK